MVRFHCCVAFACVLLSGLPAVARVDTRLQRGDANVRFRWAFSAVPKGGVALTPVRNGSSLQKGDRLKMYFKPATPVFAYVIDQAPNGALALLFPSGLARSHAAAGMEYFIPPGDNWFELDEETGREVFHLLVSSTRLQSLERALDTYAATGPAERAAAAKAVIDEMQTLRRRFFEEQSTAEVPVDLGGTSRGLEDLVRQAVDVSARDFYSRTIAIDHR
jgi:hypothetical protein